MLTVNRAALDRQIIAPQAHQRGFQSRGAIDDHEFGSFQAAGIKVIEELAPRGGALAAHVPDGKQHLLTVAAHTYGSQNRDVRGLLVDAGLDHGAVENDANDVFIGEAAGAPRVPVDLHLAPGAADHVLADGALEQPEQRPLDAPGVGAGEVDCGDQGLGLLGQALVSGQRLRPPLRHLASVILDPGTRYTHRLGPKRPGELPFAVPVAIAFRGSVTTAVAKAAEKAGELLLEYGLDRRTNVQPQTLLNRVKPGLMGQ